MDNVSCTDCNRDSLAFIMDPKEDKWGGWFGGCGDFVCTGMENMLLEDLSGHFLGYKGLIASNNQYIFTNPE